MTIAPRERQRGGTRVDGPKLRRVLQDEPTSCGIACVAMVSGRSHRQVMATARELFQWGPEQRSFYTCFKRLKQLLAAYGLQCGRRVNKSDWDTATGLAIAAINHRERDGVEYWHWVVFQRIGTDRFVLDPRSKQTMRRDFTRMKLYAYLSVRI